MRLTFSWEEWDRDLVPTCSADVLNHEGVSILASILMDDGGTSLIRSFEHIGKGLDAVDAVIAGRVGNATWERESWGASIASDKVRLYSLHDPHYSEQLDTKSFRSALRAWLEFTGTKASGEGSRIVEI